jgi:DNA polymerase/3'-5' exonuclease PolX
MDYKKPIIDALDILRKKEVANKEIFKSRAYQKVINQIRSLSKPITKYDDLKEITGIGEAIEKKIKEILETGKLRIAEEAKANYEIDAYDALQAIYGVGPTKAKELISYHIKSIEDLRKAIKSNPQLLNDKQKIGLNYYEQLKERIPHSEILDHNYIIDKFLPSEFIYEIVGSFRRMAPTSGDIDVLIRIPQNMPHDTATKLFHEYIVTLQKNNYIKEILALGDKKCMAIASINGSIARRLDLLLTPENEYPFAILYFTGSDKFNVAMRKYALDKGYTLNEHRLEKLKTTAKPVSENIKSEADIFKFLNLVYVEPANRIDEQNIVQIRKRPQVISPSSLANSPYMKP